MPPFTKKTPRTRTWQLAGWGGVGCPGNDAQLIYVFRNWFDLLPFLQLRELAQMQTVFKKCLVSITTLKRHYKVFQIGLLMLAGREVWYIDTFLFLYVLCNSKISRFNHRKKVICSTKYRRVTPPPSLTAVNRDFFLSIDKLWLLKKYVFLFTKIVISCKSVKKNRTNAIYL